MIPDSKRRRLITTALLAGLKGGACDEAGNVTARSLGDYLYNHMKKLFTKDDVEEQVVDDVIALLRLNYERTVDRHGLPEPQPAA